MIGPNLLTAWLMSYYVGAHYLLATFAGILVHITGSFFLHRRFTFKRMDVPIQIGLLLTLQGEALGIVIAFGMMAFSVEILGIGEVYARLLCVPIIVIYDYLFQSYVTFGDWRTRSGWRK